MKRIDSSFLLLANALEANYREERQRGGGGDRDQGGLVGSVDLEQSARLAHAPRDRPHANANDNQQAGHLDTGENDVELDWHSPTPREV
jgi:hypothetical protein